MKKTHSVKRKPYGTLRKSRRYRRGGYAVKRVFGLSPFALVSGSVRRGGKKRRTKRKSSRRKRGGVGTTHHARQQFFYTSKPANIA
jgi:hypothetical protein